ncbi:hypothetical protein [Chitinophaga alhagiae]|uniref:hypothetical protein n=1 Tax=Chitinophaga alhagiae TaxID=2203219 RepID=UPI000E5BBF48|nr:hypothetical protein [Chitinophaga alhagiae]
MKQHLLAIVLFVIYNLPAALAQQTPDKINFVRQGVQRMIFDENQSIPLAKLQPANIIGISAMHPAKHYLANQADISIDKNKLIVASKEKSGTAIWFGGFNPFATYAIDLDALSGEGEIGFEFAGGGERVLITLAAKNNILTDVQFSTSRSAGKSIMVKQQEAVNITGKIMLQMLGSGLVLYHRTAGLPKVIGQADFDINMDLRAKDRIHTFQSSLFVGLTGGQAAINGVEMALTTGMGLADIRPITYENGDPYLDNGRLWYTMSIRGRALPHHLQGVFSMNPTVFDVKLEGIILFDRNDGLLRNEVASHIFYDRKDAIWRGITTGFSAYANPGKEKKQLLAVESKRDPRFGFSVMHAAPFGIVGDIEDPHIVYDKDARKWRMLTCVNQNGGYKAVILESDHWNKDYRQIAGPVTHNSTGTSIQKINGRYYCFSGSSERQIFIYTYPGLKEAGTLKMDLPPWDDTANTRVWPNVVQMPEGYPFPFVALMMDRFNYPGLKGPNWTYGAIYLYHGH